MKKSEKYYTIERKKHLIGGRVIVWFSCGATSAVSAKLAVEKYKDQKELLVVYCDTGGEHESNKKFLKDVEKWIDHPIQIVKNEKYEDHWDVFEKTKYIAGIAGARCTTELKKKMRNEIQNVESDIQIFGYSVEEQKRADKFRKNNPEVYLEANLIDRELTKNDCLALLQESGIELPYMYQTQKSGAPYNHNNCIGCPKGGAGYWNKIRIDFPEQFEKMCKISKKLNVKIIKYKGKRIFLEELPEDYGNFGKEKPIECGLSCGILLEEWDEN